MFKVIFFSKNTTAENRCEINHAFVAQQGFELAVKSLAIEKRALEPLAIKSLAVESLGGSP